MKEITDVTDAPARHNNTKVTTSVLDAFDLLKAGKDDIRLSGGAKIITQLQNSENGKDTSYVVKRLVRSLGANTPDIRTAYFAALVGVLKRFPDINVAEILDLIKKELHASSGSSKSEAGDVAFGQILVCAAIFRSGLILKCTSEEQKDVIQLILNASKKKSYLSTVTHLILLDFCNQLNEEQFSSIVWTNIKQDFKKDLKDHNLDSLYFLMMINNKFPEKVKLRKLMGFTDVLCEDNIHVICDKVMTGIDFNSLQHPIYKEIAVRIANSPHLREFWISGIDTHLVKHNRNRELVAVNMLMTIFENMKESFNVIPELISKNFFKLFMDWFRGLQTASKFRSKRDNEDDNKLMIKKEKELLNSLAKVLKKEGVDNITRVETLNKLLFNPGEINFTDTTGTSIIKSIIADLDHDSVKKIAKKLKGILLNVSKKFVREGVERSWYNNERLKAAELLSYLVTHDAVKDDKEFKLTYMKLLMCFGFFKIGGDENVAVSNELSGAIKSCFYRCFTSRFTNVDSLVDVLSSLTNFINSTLENERVKAKLEKQFTAKNMECWEMHNQICKAIEKSNQKSKVDKVFLILLHQLGLFLFSEPAHVKVASDCIKELKSCYEHYKKGKKKKSKINKDKSNLEDEPEWIEVLVEVLLSVLSTESSVLRSVVQCVFRLLNEYLTPSSVGQIVSVLDPESDSNPLSQDSDSEDGGSDKESDDEKDSENEEKVNGNDEEKEDSEDSSSDDDDDDKDEEMKDPEQLRMAVQKALGAAAPDSDTESIDVDRMTEEEANKLDEALAEAFRQFNQGKTKKTKKERKDKKALSDFRTRVLDLVDIYLEKDPSMDICLAMIAPLTRCLEFCLQDNQFIDLANRVRKTIKLLTKIRKFSSTDDVTLEILSDYLKTVIDKGSRSHFMYQALGDVITNIGTFIIHCSQKITTNQTPKKKKSSPITQIFKDALQSYFQNRSCLLPIIFFHNVLQTEWEGNYELVPILIENAFSSSVRHFRRNEALDLLAGFYRSLKRCKPSSDKLIADLCRSEKQFEEILKKTFKGEVEFEAKSNFFNVLKKLLNTMKMVHESSKIKTTVDFNSLLEIVGSNKSSIKIKNDNVPNEQKQVNGNGKKRKGKKNKRKIEKVNGHGEVEGKRARKNSSLQSYLGPSFYY